MAKTLKDEIIEQVERLASPQQRKVLNFARQLGESPGVPGGELLRFAGSIPAPDLNEMTQAIAEGCETIEQNAW